MATKADHGDGSCKQVKTGRLAGEWRVQYRYEDAKGVKKRLSRLFPTQREGKDFLRALRRNEGQVAAQVAKEMTFGEWFTWLAENEWPDTLDPKTIRDRQSRYKKYAAPRWDKVALTKIDPLDVKSFYQGLRVDGVGAHTCIALKASLVRAFNQAISPYRRVPHYWSNPFCLNMATPERRTAVALTPEQAVKALKSKALDDSRRALLGVFLLAGLRLGEQMALTKGQVRLTDGLIDIDRAVKLTEKSAQSVGLPKGDKVRTVVMCPSLQSLLKPLLVGLADGDYLWPAMSDNKPRMKKLAYATWRTIVKDAKLPTDMSPHDCRLTHINWIEKLMPEVSSTTLKEHVGHSADGVTQVNYTRPITPSQTILRDGLEKIVGLAAPKKGA